MEAVAAVDEPPILSRRLTSRGDLTGFFMQLTAEIGADSYMLAALVSGQDRPELSIVASNWVYDAISLVGNELIVRLLLSRLSASPCSPAGPLDLNRQP